MSTTASDHQTDSGRYWGKSITNMAIDEWSHMTKPMNTNIDDYEIRRLGYKDYVVLHKPDRGTWGSSGIVARYACSHIEAKRRWTMKLITSRLAGKPV